MKVIFLTLLSVVAVGQTVRYNQIKSTDRNGNGTKVQMFTGTSTVDHVAKFDASGNLVDGGAITPGGEVGVPESTVVANSGTGAAVLKTGTNVTAKTLVGGTNITITGGTDEITIAASTSAIPTGAVMFFNLAACPSGWAELTAARGRYVVGKPSGGTLAGTAGTALTNQENRAVGQHTHTVTDPGHDHEYDKATVVTTGTGGPSGAVVSIAAAGTEAAMTDLTVDNTGAVTGTNAPYIQLLVCSKS
jgi:hypothetical protein